MRHLSIVLLILCLGVPAFAASYSPPPGAPTTGHYYVDTSTPLLPNQVLLNSSNPLPTNAGGSGATTPAGAPFALKGVNTDITSIAPNSILIPYSSATGGALDSKTLQFLSGNSTLPAAATSDKQLYFLKNANPIAILTVTSSETNNIIDQFGNSLTTIGIPPGSAIWLQCDGSTWREFQGADKFSTQYGNPLSGTINDDALQFLAGDVSLPAVNGAGNVNKIFFLKNNTVAPIVVTSAETGNIVSADITVSTSITLPPFAGIFINSDGAYWRVFTSDDVTVAGDQTLTGTKTFNAATREALSQPIVFGNQGTVASATTAYLYPGSGIASVAEVQIKIPRAMTLKSISVHSTAAPGGFLTDTFTVRKNGSDTALAVSLVGSDVDETVTTDVSFAAGDLLSVKLVSDTLSLDTDPMVTIEAY